MAAQSELLLTEYLLNFEEENDEECSFETEAFSCDSGDEDTRSLSVLKETLKVKPKNLVKKPSTNKPVAEKIQDRKEKKRISSKAYRKKRSIEIQTTMEECKQLKETNKALSDKNVEMEKTISNLEKKVKYLESVMANESSLSTVLGTIANLSGLSFGNNPLQVTSQKRKRVEGVSDENEPETKIQNSGVCLHLKPGRMTLEFCRECSDRVTKEC